MSSESLETTLRISAPSGSVQPLVRSVYWLGTTSPFHVLQCASFQSIAAVRIPAKALSRILRHSALGIIWDRFGVRVGHPCRLNSISLGVSHKCFTATATRRGAGDLLLFIFAALPRGYFGGHCMSWHSFYNAWQRIDIEEDVSSLIQSAFARGPEVARRGSSDFRRRLTASLKAFRTLRTCLLATSAPDSAVQLCNIRLREIEGWDQVDLQAQTWLEETLPEIRALFHHPTPSSASDLHQGLGGSGTLDSGRPLPPQPPTPRAANRRTGRHRSRSPVPEPSSSAAAASAEEIIVSDSPPLAPRERVLVTLDWHKVVDKDFRDSRSFIEAIDQTQGVEVCWAIVSYSGLRRGRENKATSARIFPGVPFYRTDTPEEKAPYVRWLAREYQAVRAIHIDDRSDLCEQISDLGSGFSSLVLPLDQPLSSLVIDTTRYLVQGD